MLSIKKLAVLSITFTTTLTSASGLGGNSGFGGYSGFGGSKQGTLLPKGSVPTKKQLPDFSEPNYVAWVRNELKKPENEPKFVPVPDYKEVIEEVPCGMVGPKMKVVTHVDRKTGQVTYPGECIIL